MSRRKLGPPGHEYATVWSWRVPWTNYSVRLHYWYGHDDTRAYHSHGQWFATLVVWGGYEDHSPGLTPLKDGGCVPSVTVDRLGWLSFRVRPAEYRHFVLPGKRGAWTLLLFGGPKRHWDFYDKQTGKRYKRDKWFSERGHHTQDGTAPVRLRPDGSIIGAASG